MLEIASVHHKAENLIVSADAYYPDSRLKSVVEGPD